MAVQKSDESQSVVTNSSMLEFFGRTVVQRPFDQDEITKPYKEHIRSRMLDCAAYKGLKNLRYVFPNNGFFPNKLPNAEKKALFQQLLYCNSLDVYKVKGHFYDFHDIRKQNKQFLT